MYKCSSWAWGTPARFINFKKYIRYVALDRIASMCDFQEKSKSKWATKSLTCSVQLVGRACRALKRVTSDTQCIQLPATGRSIGEMSNYYKTRSFSCKIVNVIRKVLLLLCTEWTCRQTLLFIRLVFVVEQEQYLWYYVVPWFRLLWVM